MVSDQDLLTEVIVLLLVRLSVKAFVHVGVVRRLVVVLLMLVGVVAQIGGLVSLAAGCYAALERRP